MVAIVALGLEVGRSAFVQKRAIARIEAVGGRVAYVRVGLFGADRSYSAGTKWTSDPCQRPLWWGRHLFESAVSVRIVGPSLQLDVGTLRAIGRLGSLRDLTIVVESLPADSFEAIGRLGSLRSLTLIGGIYGDVYVAPLARLTELRRLDIGGFTFADRNYQSFENLRHLETLWIRDNRVSQGAGLSHLIELERLRCLVFDGFARIETLAPLLDLPGLETLVVQASPLSDGLRGLNGMSSLRRLDLALCSIDDEDLADLRGLDRLTDLTLDQTAITGAGLRHLTGLTVLERLDLSRTRVDDDGLMCLIDLTHLRRIELYQTDVTDAGALRFREECPDVTLLR